MILQKRFKWLCHDDSTNEYVSCQECRKVSLQGKFREDSIVNLDISADGAWQRRDYASLHGLVTIVAMDTNQCVE